MTSFIMKSFRTYISFRLFYDSWSLRCISIKVDLSHLPWPAACVHRIVFIFSICPFNYLLIKPMSSSQYASAGCTAVVQADNDGVQYLTYRLRRQTVHLVRYERASREARSAAASLPVCRHVTRYSLRDHTSLTSFRHPTPGCMQVASANLLGRRQDTVTHPMMHLASRAAHIISLEKMHATEKNTRTNIRA